MSIRPSMLAALLLGAALPSFAQNDHTLPSTLAPAGKPVLIPKEGGTGNVFGEGVAADWQGNIYSNEMDNNDRTMQLKVGEDMAKAWRKAADDPNGMWLDTQNRLIICQKRAMVRVKTGASWDGQTDTLYKYPAGTGQDFNDVTGDSKDNLYFTNYQGRTVFFRHAATGKIDTVLRNQNLPNGIEWDEERKVVYLNLNGGNKVVAYSVNDDFSLTFIKDFATFQGPDGITLDQNGNIYSVAFGDRVHVFNPAGQKQGEIAGFSGQQLTNLAFGGTDFKTLYMITNKGLYKLPMNVKGYKSGNYSVAIRNATISPDNHRRSRALRFHGNGILAIHPVHPSASTMDLTGRLVIEP